MRHLAVFFLLFLYCVRANAQVPVHEEPRHRPVFQNDQIRILNVQLPPGDTTQYHLHHTPSLFVFFTSTTTGSQMQGGQPATGRSTAGTLLFENLAPPHVRVHRVWNLDTGTFHVMDIELLSTDSGFKEKPLTGPHLQLAVDTPWARAYNLVLEEQNDFSIQGTHHAFVLIALNIAHIQLQKGNAIEQKNVQEGSFFWIAAGQKFMLKNVNSTTARFALLELP